MWLSNPDGSIYFISDELPEPTAEYNQAQLLKTYWTGSEIRSHPGWRYDNSALVDDDYLFYNENWLRIIDQPPVYDAINEVQVKNSPDQWTKNTKTITITYTTRPKTEEELASDRDLEWAEVRRIRDQKLAALDRYVFIAYENGWTMSQLFRDYRQSLRDITETFTDPYSVVWPEEPDSQYFYN
jgi:hypothetical protein